MAAEAMDIVIVGGGICGLAAALALHRKGIRSVVLERSETLRATGAAIGLFPNGWRALRHLGLDATLGSAAIPFNRALDVWVDKGVERETHICEEEARCFKRSDLIEALAKDLPSGTIRYGCQVLSVNLEKESSNPVLQLSDGSIIRAKVLIGCDGAHSIIADFIGLKPTKLYSKCAVRGLTIYPNGHGFTPEFLRIWQGKCLVGRIPIDDNTVYWFTFMDGSQRESEMAKDPTSIKALSLERTSSFPIEIIDMIKNSDLGSVSLRHLRYRPPLSLLFENFNKESVTVAGDACHFMGPFLGQGGSAALEDAIALARCLSKKAYDTDSNGNRVLLSQNKVREALDEYVKERRLRIVHLSTMTYLRGLLLIGDPSMLVRFMCIVVMTVLFRNSFKHIRYDCGQL